MKHLEIEPCRRASMFSEYSSGRSEMVGVQCCGHSFNLFFWWYICAHLTTTLKVLTWF